LQPSPPDGYVYQKAYIEFFCSPAHLDAIEQAIREDKAGFKSLVYNAVNARGDIRASELAGSSTGSSSSSSSYGAGSSSPSNSPSDPSFKRSVCAVTWGVFPGREILQPTVVDTESFLVWKEEAFDLWLSSWASIYSEESEAYEILYDIHDSVFLVNVVDNDYIKGDIFKVFDRALEIMNKANE
jgi:methylenetetrahydrofolate reductase (NADPH)